MQPLQKQVGEDGQETDQYGANDQHRHVAAADESQNKYTQATGANISMVPISFGDLLGASIIVGITFALARNLPGLLEVGEDGRASGLGDL